MGRVAISTRNHNGVRLLTEGRGLGYFYDGYRGPAEPAPHAAMTPANLGLGAILPRVSPAVVSRTGSVLGMSPNQSGGPHIAVIGPGIRSGICPAWGCGAPPIVRPFGAPSNAPPVSSQTTPTPTVNTSGSPGSTSAQSAGSPVPVGYPTNSIYVGSNGALWAFSSTTGAWENVGTPYNLDSAQSAAAPAAASVAPAAAPAAASSLLSTAAEVAGTPVPVGYPITSPYYDSQGNTWTFNASSGWAVSSLSSSEGSSAVTPTAAATPSASFTDQVASWLGSSTAIGGTTIPNALLAAGVVVISAFFMKGKR